VAHIRRGGHRFESGPRYIKGFGYRQSLFYLHQTLMHMFYAYALYSKKFDKTYTGYTSDPESRLKSHNDLATKGWTIRFRPWEMIYCEAFQSKSEAMAQEKFLKTGAGRDFIKRIIEKQQN